MGRVKQTEKNIFFGVIGNFMILVVGLIQRKVFISVLGETLLGIDGLYTDDPRSNRVARFISYVDSIDDKLEAMAKGADTALGTGGMTTKLAAARIACGAGVDMVIANGNDVRNINRILNGEETGTLFKA